MLIAVGYMLASATCTPAHARSNPARSDTSGAQPGSDAGPALTQPAPTAPSAASEGAAGDRGRTPWPAGRPVPKSMEWFSRTPFGRTAAGTWFARGGGSMWPLLLFAIVTLVVVLERAWTLGRARTNTRRLIGGIITSLRNDGVTAATQVCERTRGPIAAILHSGLLRADRGPDAVEKAIEAAGTIELSYLERGLLLLAASASIAPLIGFLGTVSGMIHALDAIADGNPLSARLVAAGISEALISALAGLLIAIPASVAHSFFLSVIDRFIIEMEESAAELVDELSQVSG